MLKYTQIKLSAGVSMNYQKEGENQVLERDRGSRHREGSASIKKLENQFEDQREDSLTSLEVCFEVHRKNILYITKLS